MTVRILHGNCLDLLPVLVAEGVRVHSVVTDPPYHLTTGKKSGAGFMGKAWDGGNIAMRPETWRLVFDVLFPGGWLLAFGGTRTWHRQAMAIEDAGFEIRDTIAWMYGSGFPKSHNLPGGLGTALKPAFEPIVMARKPFKGTVAENVAENGCGALNIKASRVAIDESERSTIDSRSGAGFSNNVFGGSIGRSEGLFVSHEMGRWPANIMHDGSDEVVATFPDAPGQQGGLNETGRARPSKNIFGDMGPPRPHPARKDSGSAARFFYSAKADASDRVGSKHPTVKPTDLMRYLVQLVTPPGGTVLDPFAGTGSTGLAADQLGFNAILVEQEATYVADAQRKVTSDCPMFASVA